MIRRFLPILLLFAGFAGLAVTLPATVGAARGARLAAAPNPVSFGQVLTVTGRGWPVIEFCERTVALSLRSDQNAVRVGHVRIGDRGGFVKRWTPQRAVVGAGRWRLVARLRCESGNDGSPVPVVRSVAIRIR